MRKTTHITTETLDKITSVLIAKALDPEQVPVEFATAQDLKSRDLNELSERQGQALLAWLDQLPDDQPAEKEPAAPAEAEGVDPEAHEAHEAHEEAHEAHESSPAETAQEEDGNGEGKDDIRKAEDYIMVKRPLTAAELEGNLEELYKLAGTRASAEIALDNYKSAAKSAQKTIDVLDAETFRIIREMKENAVEEKVAALRVTNYTTGLISWFHQETGELLPEQAIKPGEPLPLDLSGGANNPAADGPADEPPAAATEDNGPAERSCETCYYKDDPSPARCLDCNYDSDARPNWKPIVDGWRAASDDFEVKVGPAPAAADNEPPHDVSQDVTNP